MKKKSSVSSVAERAVRKRKPSTWVRMSESEISQKAEKLRVSSPSIARPIDFSEIPELTSEQMARARRVGPGRPLLGEAPRKLISIKIDPSLLNSLKGQALGLGIGYQTLIHSVLEKHIRRTRR